MSDELSPGMLVGRYQLLFRLGKGGMGEVWAASQAQSEFGFQKLIALKVLRSKEIHSNAAVMFFDEAKAASALQHQAIVSTVDLGRDDDILFIAMDMVRGPSLTALLQRLENPIRTPAGREPRSLQQRAARKSLPLPRQRADDGLVLPIVSEQ